MKFTLGWLADHLDFSGGLDVVVATLTRIGLEVESVDDAGAALAGFRVARVIDARPHPQAERLQILSIDAGADWNGGGPVQVVCGATNARVGMIGVFGGPGMHVPGIGVTLGIAEIRGVMSAGMMCSARELGIGDGHDGIIDLASDAAVGMSYPTYAGLDDPVLDVAITPNRQDCMGVRGIARDLAAAGIGVLRPLVVAPVAVGDAPAPAFRIDDAEGCPALYAQAVAGVVNGDAPETIRRRLRAIGQKPISALVDVTNYVMIDLGRPLHVYDRARLSGPLIVRRATQGETITALNGRDYALDPAMTVIADDVAVHDIGGIMGGAHSAVSADTADVIVECAWFDPAGIARTGQALGLTSDARQRFERGVDPDFLDDGLAIAVGMIIAICGGTASAVTRAGSPPDGPRTVDYDPALAASLGGMPIAPARQRDILECLGFGVDPVSWRVTVPGWRRDVDGAADLVEEVIRIEGIDRVPPVALDRIDGVAVPTATADQRMERRVRRAAAARGLNEAVTWSFVAPREADWFGGGAWRLANPISQELAVMRPSLLPGLLLATARNLNRGADGVRLFEIGRRYLAEGERATLAAVLAGERRGRHWQAGKAVGFDAFDAKADAEALLAAAGAPVATLTTSALAGADGVVPDCWHPGQAATLRLGPKNVLAVFGMLHPRLCAAFDLTGPVAAVELFLDAVPRRRAVHGSKGAMRPTFGPPRLQPVRRDFAFVVPGDLAAEQLVRAVRGADKEAIVAATPFDVFVGDGIAAGFKSLAVEVTLQPDERSFTEAELAAIGARIVAAAARVGAVLRG